MQPSLCRAIQQSEQLEHTVYSIRLEEKRERRIKAVIWDGASVSAIQMHFLTIVAGGNATPTINNGMIFLIVHCAISLFASFSRGGSHVVWILCVIHCDASGRAHKQNYGNGFIGKVFHPTKNIDQTNNAFNWMFAVDEKCVERMILFKIAE